MNWGKWIVVSFVAFATFIGFLVTVCVRQDINLESKEYYKEELAYQQQLDRKQNASELEYKPEFSIDNNRNLKLTFQFLNRVESGQLILFSPSNPEQDAHFQIQSRGTKEQLFDVSKMNGGHYKARMKWTMDGKEFFVEETIFI
jgi:hypothetical protein